MLTKISSNFETNHNSHKTEQIIDICEDLRILGLPFEMINKIKSIMDIDPFEDTITYVYNPDGIHFYYYPDLCSGGVTFDFEAYNKNNKQ